MIKCETPHDIRKYQNRMYAGFTGREALYIFAGVILSGMMFGFLYHFIRMDRLLSSIVSIFILAFFVYAGFRKPCGIPFINFVVLYMQTYVNNPSVRYYKSDVLREEVPDCDIPLGSSLPKRKKTRQDIQEVKFWK